MLAQAGATAPTPPAHGAAPAYQLSLDQAIQLALQHSPALAAARTTVPQSQAQEITANLRPNPVLSWDALYFPVFTPGQISSSYLNNSAEFDATLGYTIERGGKRAARLRAARDATTVVRDQLSDNTRTLTFNVAQQYVNVLLAKSNLALARQDLASWQQTADVSQAQYKAGAISEGDLDTVELQTLQFQTAISSNELSLAQALVALRQQIGFSGVPTNYDVAGQLAFEPVPGNLQDMQAAALRDRPDLAAARDGITAAQSQHQLAIADGKRDLTATGQLTHTAGVATAGALFSIEIPLFDRNQGEIARTAAATTQAQDQAQVASEQVLTDVATAFAAVQQGAQVVGLYTSGYRAQAAQALSIRRYSYSRGASSLLDLLDAERTERATEVGYRQALAAYMLAVEQLKEAVGTRSLP